jgi:hypothetical protein
MKLKEFLKRLLRAKLKNGIRLKQSDWRNTYQSLFVPGVAAEK